MAGDVTLRGRLGRDPELRFTKSGKAVASMNVVTDRRAKNQQGDWESVDTTWWRVTCWDQLAEHVAESFVKGDPVIVVGSASMQEYQTKDGEDRQSLSVNAWDVGPSLRWCVAKVQRAERNAPTDAQWETGPVEAPF